MGTRLITKTLCRFKFLNVILISNIVSLKNLSLNYPQIYEDRENVELYNLKKDPYEENNLSQKAYGLVEKLKERLMELYRTKMVLADYPRHNKIPKSNPALYNNFLSSGWC